MCVSANYESIIPPVFPYVTVCNTFRDVIMMVYVGDGEIHIHFVMLRMQAASDCVIHIHFVMPKDLL